MATKLGGFKGLHKFMEVRTVKGYQLRILDAKLGISLPQNTSWKETVEEANEMAACEYVRCFWLALMRKGGGALKELEELLGEIKTK